MNAKYRGNKKLQNSRIIKGEEHVKIYSHPDKKCLYYNTSMLSRFTICRHGYTLATLNLMGIIWRVFTPSRRSLKYIELQFLN